MPGRSTQDNDLYRIEHMISFCEKIVKYGHEFSTRDPDESEIRILALLRLFETLGEAANKVSRELKSRYPEVPWVEASDTRNRLIHGYDDLDTSILWHTVQHNIPPLLDQLRGVRSELLG